jgi:hypothetical protein
MLEKVSMKSQNYWGFGLSPTSGIPKNREHVLENGSVSVLR